MADLAQFYHSSVRNRPMELTSPALLGYSIIINQLRITKYIFLNLRGWGNKTPCVQCNSYFVWILTFYPAMSEEWA